MYFRIAIINYYGFPFVSCVPVKQNQFVCLDVLKINYKYHIDVHRRIINNEYLKHKHSIRYIQYNNVRCVLASSFFRAKYYALLPVSFTKIFREKIQINLEFSI